MPILKLKRHNSKKEIEFELRYLKSLSMKDRFKMMFRKTKEMVDLLERYGHRKPFDKKNRDSPNQREIDALGQSLFLKMKRAAGRPQDLEDLKYLKKLKKI